MQAGPRAAGAGPSQARGSVRLKVASLNLQPRLLHQAQNGSGLHMQAGALPAPPTSLSAQLTGSRLQARITSVPRPTAARAAAGAAALPAEPARTPPSQAVKITGLAVMFFVSTFNYTILQNLKDSIVVTAVGAEALPFLEAYGVLPLSLAFFMLYNWLNRSVPEKWVYQLALAPFLAFYALFAMVLYPNASVLHPTHLLEGLKSALPAGLVGLAGMITNWCYSLFFCAGELWGGVAISLLFWSLADDVCTMSEAKNVYPLLGFVANIGLVLAGAWIKTVNSGIAHGNPVLAVQLLVGTVIAAALGMLLVKGFVHDKFVITDPSELAAKKAKKEAKSAKKEKGPRKGGFRDTLMVLKRSPKVANLAILVVSYFVVQKLFDISWKAQLRVFYPSTEEYGAVLANVAQLTGIATMVLMATSKYVFKFGGWIAAALATPLSIILSGGIFFASAIAMQGGAGALGPNAVALLTAAGGVAGIIGRVVSRAPKFSLMDPAKEMVYITMTKEEKTEGKATVDLLGSYVGKSGASWIMQALVLITGSMTASMPIMALCHLGIGLFWINATVKLGALMKGAEAAHGQEPNSSAAPAAPSAQAVVAASENGNGNGNGVVSPEQLLQSGSVITGDASRDGEEQQPAAAAPSLVTAHAVASSSSESDGNNGQASNSVVSFRRTPSGRALHALPALVADKIVDEEAVLQSVDVLQLPSEVLPGQAVALQSGMTDE